MSDPKELKPGDPCPTCGGELVPDPTQDPEAIAARPAKNYDNPAARHDFVDAVRAKAAESGVIHRCVRCGYRARLQAPKTRGKKDAA